MTDQNTTRVARGAASVLAGLTLLTALASGPAEASRFHVRRHMRHGAHRLRASLHRGHQHLHNLVHHGHM